jgi:hypothetical protein
LKPSLSEAHYSLGCVLKSLVRFEEVLGALGQAAILNPSHVNTRIVLCNLRRVACDWRGLDQEEQDLLGQLRVQPQWISPFALVAMQATSAQDYLSLGKRYADSLGIDTAAIMSSPTPPPSAFTGKRLRVG